MLKITLAIIISLFCTNVYGEDSLLTIKQQVERLQRDVNDLSKSFFTKNEDQEPSQNNLSSNFSALDIRIYDLENDIKNLTLLIEELNFNFEDFSNKIINLENSFDFLDKELSTIKSLKTSVENKDDISLDISNNSNSDNTLGTLSISSDENLEDQKEVTKNEETIDSDLLPEEQFQLAFDSMRKKNYDEALDLFTKFIEIHPESPLAGSAHYWLGELYILKNNYRESALVLAEGFQKYPDSIKSADTLYRLSYSLFSLEKNNEACSTLNVLINKFPKSKLIKNVNSQILEKNCQTTVE